MDKYEVRNGPYQGQVGIMVGRIANASNDDIKLRFNDGKECWFWYGDTTKVLDQTERNSEKFSEPLVRKTSRVSPNYSGFPGDGEISPYLH